MIQSVSRSHEGSKAVSRERLSPLTLGEISASVATTDRYLLYSGNRVDERGALDLLAKHLGAELISEDSIEELGLQQGVHYLILSKFQSESAVSSESIASRLELISELSRNQEPSVKTSWVGIVAHTKLLKGKGALFPELIPLANHFWLSDMSTLLCMDPDFWFHECLQRNAKEMYASISSISESLAAILECTRWRYGRMELDLFCRDLIRNSDGDPVLGLHHVPEWFRHPVLIFLESQALDFFE